MCSRRHATVSVLQRVLRYGFPFAPCTYAAFKSALVRAPTPRGESGPDRAARPRPRRHRSYDTCSVHCLTLAEYKTPTTPRRHTTARINITGVPALAGGGLLPSEREARARPRRSTAEHDAATKQRHPMLRPTARWWSVPGHRPRHPARLPRTHTRFARAHSSRSRSRSFSALVAMLPATVIAPIVAATPSPSTTGLLSAPLTAISAPACPADT